MDMRIPVQFTFQRFKETAKTKLVEFNEIYGKGKGEVKTTTKKTRRAGGSRKKTTETPATEKTEAAKTEE